MSYVGAIRAAQLGLKVGLIERDKLGGTCLNRGCIPSKALLETADLLHRVHEQGGEFGLAGHEGISLDYPALGARRDAVVDKHVKGVEFLMKKNGVTVIRGHGTLTGPTSVARLRRRVRRCRGQRHRPDAGHGLRAALAARPGHRRGADHHLRRGAEPRRRPPQRVTIVGAGRDRRGVGQHVPRLRRGGAPGRVPGPASSRWRMPTSARSSAASSASAASPCTPVVDHRHRDDPAHR